MDVLAAIDVGTNSVLLTVAARAGDGLRPLVERAEITRLGRGVDQTKRLADDGIQATLRVLGAYAEEAEALGVKEPAQIACVCTSAARDAQNGAAFLQMVQEQCGLSPRIIDGEREAQLTFVAARRDFGQKGGPLAIMDIGGGSTEIAVNLDLPGRFTTSLPIGSVRLHERLGQDRARIHREIDRVLVGVPRLEGGLPVVGVAGTWTTLATLALELPHYDAERVHGYRLSLATLDELTDRLWKLSLPERLLLPGLQPGRADVIPVGALIAGRGLQALGATEAIVSDRGVRWGLLYEHLEASGDSKKEGAD
jgi:exopolyphosphatase/guanosine-5'-triphosphate,3'-diphosphate pyrophosphatase